MRAVTALALTVLAACDATPLPPLRQVSDSGFGAYEVSLATWPDRAAVAWYDTRDGNAEIYVRWLDAAGGTFGAELRVTNSAEQSYEADIAPLGDGFAIAWYEKYANGRLRAQLGAWERDGTLLWHHEIAVGAGNSRNPVVRAHGDALFVAWIEADATGGEFVWGGWWQRDGYERGAPTRLGPVGPTTWNLNAAVTDTGIALVVFDAVAGTRVEELFLATLEDGRAKIAALTADDGLRSKYPDLAVRDTQAALTWFDERDGNREVYLAVAPLAQLKAAAESRARRVTMTPGQSIGAYLAWSGERLGLAWSDDTGGNYEVYFQRFDRDGGAVASPVPLSRTPAQSLIPAIRPWRDGFVVAWDEVAPAAAGVHDDATRAEIVFTTVR